MVETSKFIHISNNFKGDLVNPNTILELSPLAVVLSNLNINTMNLYKGQDNDTQLVKRLASIVLLAPLRRRLKQWGLLSSPPHLFALFTQGVN